MFRALREDRRKVSNEFTTLLGIFIMASFNVVTSLDRPVKGCCRLKKPNISNY
jgi:hypothetical protein